MKTDRHAVILFFTSNHAFRAEKVLKDRGFIGKLVPVPRHLSSGCGVCLRIEQSVVEEVRTLLLAYHVEIDKVHEL